MRWLTSTNIMGMAVAAVLAFSASSLAQITSLSPDAASAVDHAVVQLLATINPGGSVRAIGSGVIIDPSGFIITAEHVVRRAAAVEVLIRDEVRFPARVVGRDRLFDVALLRGDPPPGLLHIPLGSSMGLRPGDPLAAFGRSPRRLSGPTVGTLTDVDLEVRAGIPHLHSTAIVWPGDSGGALVDLNGAVVGLIVGLTLTHGDKMASVSLASDAIGQILSDLHAGTVRHPWLGIVGSTVTAELARELNLTAPAGVVVLQVIEGGPAARAGLRGGQPALTNSGGRGGDVITAIDGQPVTSLGGLATYVLSRRVGDTIVLLVNRHGTTLSVPVVLDEFPSP